MGYPKRPSIGIDRTHQHRPSTSLPGFFEQKTRFGEKKCLLVSNNNSQSYKTWIPLQLEKKWVTFYFLESRVHACMQWSIHKCSHTKSKFFPPQNVDTCMHHAVGLLNHPKKRNSKHPVVGLQKMYIPKYNSKHFKLPPPQKKRGRRQMKRRENRQKMKTGAILQRRLPEATRAVGTEDGGNVLRFFTGRDILTGRAGSGGDPSRGR